MPVLLATAALAAPAAYAQDGGVRGTTFTAAARNCEVAAFAGACVGGADGAGARDLTDARTGFGDTPGALRAIPQDTLLSQDEIVKLQARRLAKPEATKRDEPFHLPEPATWALLILGFGAVGGMMRRKLRQSEARFTERMQRISSGDDD